MANNTLERTGKHRGRTVRALAVCARAGAEKRRRAAAQLVVRLQMNNGRWLAILATVGFVLGPLAHASAAAAQPPIEWPAVQVAASVGALAAFGLMAIQFFMRQIDAVRAMFSRLLRGGVFFTASGVGAWVWAAFHGDFGPSSIFIVAVGAGVLAGLFIGRGTFRGAFAA